MENMNIFSNLKHYYAITNFLRNVSKKIEAEKMENDKEKTKKKSRKISKETNRKNRVKNRRIFQNVPKVEACVSVISGLAHSVRACANLMHRASYSEFHNTFWGQGGLQPKPKPQLRRQIGPSTLKRNKENLDSPGPR